MTDQDPTQPYQPPAAPPAPATPPAPPAAPAAPVDAPPAAPVTTAPPAPAYAAAEPTAVPTAPVAAATGGRPGRSKVKWIVAGVATLLIAGTAAGATLRLTSDAGDPAVLSYAPADSVAYTELRLDLPGNQAAELAEVMKAFPGFEDQAAFPVKLSEMLDLLTGKASDGKVSWKTDIEPWFGGQVGMAVGPLPSMDAPEDGRALALVSVKDAALATAWLDGIAAEEGASTAPETYNGVEITVVTPAAGAMAEVKAGYAVVGPVLLVGDLTSIKAAIDTGGKTGLAADTEFQEASATITGDRLGFFWADLETITDSVESMAGAAAEAMPAMPSFMDDFAVPWVVGAVRAEDGAFVIESRSPHVDAMIGPSTATESKLPGLVPPTTVVLAEGHDVGATLAELKDLLASEPDLKDAVDQVDQALAIVGGFEAVTGWMGEAGIAITRDGEDIAGGLVVTPTDAAAAEKLMNQLKAFVQLGGGEMGVTVSDETYGDATITVVDLSGLGGLVGAMSEGAVEAPSDLKLAYAVTDEVVVLGVGTDFVKAVLDARTGESLADTERFATALTQAGKEHASLFWLDITGVREAVEAMAPDEMFGEDYAADVKPYLEAFDSMISVSIPGETIDSGTVIIRVTGD